MTEEPRHSGRRQSQKRFFRSAASAPQISADAASREGAIIRFAVAKLGAADAMSFLNEIDSALNGRPLQVAAATDDGAIVVRDAVIARAANSALEASSVG